MFDQHQKTPLQEIPPRARPARMLSHESALQPTPPLRTAGSESQLHGGKSDLQQLFSHFTDATRSDSVDARSPTHPINNDIPLLQGAPPTKSKKSATTTKTDEQKPDTIEDFIRIVGKVEKAFPKMSGEQLLNNLRVYGRNDDQNFRKMYGLDKLNKDELREKYGRPVMSNQNDDSEYLDLFLRSGKIKPKDIASLKRMLNHSDEDHGLAKDSFGNDVALSHVLTGLTAGQYRNPDTDLRPEGFKGTLSRIVGAGHNVDNLYATTIAGDLGQSAVFHQMGKSKNLIGEDTDASNPELIGDIDGYMLGKHLPDLSGKQSLSKVGPDGLQLSQLLSEYYNPQKSLENDGNKINAAHRFSNAKNELTSGDGLSNLFKETSYFAEDYHYAQTPYKRFVDSDVGDLTNSIQAVSDFKNWTEINATRESLRNTATQVVTGALQHPLQPRPQNRE